MPTHTEGLLNRVRWVIELDASAELVADGFDPANQIKNGAPWGGELSRIGRIVDSWRPEDCVLTVRRCEPAPPGGGSAEGPTLGGVAAACQNGCIVPIGGDPACPDGVCRYAEQLAAAQGGGSAEFAEHHIPPVAAVGHCAQCRREVGRPAGYAGEAFLCPDCIRLGGGSVRSVPPERPGNWLVGTCSGCGVDSIAAKLAAEAGRAALCYTCERDAGKAQEPAPLPPVRRCPERVSNPGEAIENCDAVIGRDVQCFVCLGARCYIHCGCLAHHKGAKVVSRGGQGSFEWCVWEFEHAFRGQPYAKAADGSGLVILGTHGGASSEAVLSILLRSLENIQGRKVRGEVVGQSAKARPTNEAAGELADVGDPEKELRDLDAKVVLLLERTKRQHDAVSAMLQRQRVNILRICQDWIKATEHTWQEAAEDPDQNPRLVWLLKELHDQQVADLFFQLGELFNGGAL